MARTKQATLPQGTPEELEEVTDTDLDLSDLLSDEAGPADGACELCDAEGMGVRFRVNPYDERQHGVTNKQFLCDECYEDLRYS